VNEIAAKLADALSMFWLSLNEQERRLILIGGCYVAATLLLLPIERRRREREQEELAERVARRLEVARYG